MPSYDRALHALRTWLDTWAGIGYVAACARGGATLLRGRDRHHSLPHNQLIPCGDEPYGIYASPEEVGNDG